MKKASQLLTLPLVALFISGYLALVWPPIASAADQSLPGPIAALAEQGLGIVDTFKAPAGLTGYAARFRGRPVAIYLTQDAQHALVGTLVDAQGNNLTSELLERIVSGPQSEKAWAQLASASWVRDGSKSANTIIYEFTDPNCPYCHKFWQMARPWVKAGKVQIRHVLVGILKPSSAPKAATILAADDPEAALARSERHYGKGGIQIAQDISDSARAKVAANNDLMKSLGYFATPTILYKKDNGEVGVKQGLPRGKEIKAILGDRPSE